MNSGNRFPIQIALVLAFLLGGTVARVSAQEAGGAECRAMPSAVLDRAVRYCVLLPPGFATDPARRFPIVYHLHGLGGDEQWLLNGGGWDMVEQAREQGKIGEFVIVTPDAGRTFYVNSRDGEELYEDFFIKEFVPAVENRYRAGGSRQTRALAGVSMGGYGALRFAFKYPQMFSAVAVHSAALIENFPEDATVMFGRNFRAFGDPLDNIYWAENNPLSLARSADSLGTLQIYFDCGLQDDYGFDSGTSLLHDILEQRNVPHEFHLYPGGHDWEYVADHFAESLASLSGALGLD